ncbi:uncharacterized protein LOC127120928 isoform X2 [Lathyrus oleraceus]|uniref:uncharacterized protein LOC127120928 isoform X2 n=2 Tax=Pisum sativum TaxID=3888 RepID=UPI0021CDEFC2|nr:uncharacterized protein LOC127120928 isoform X2 [Pisum sativum]
MKMMMNTGEILFPSVVLHDGLLQGLHLAFASKTRLCFLLMFHGVVLTCFCSMPLQNDSWFYCIVVCGLLTQTYGLQHHDMALHIVVASQVCIVHHALNMVCNRSCATWCSLACSTMLLQGHMHMEVG